MEANQRRYRRAYMVEKETKEAEEAKIDIRYFPHFENIFTV